MRPDRIVIGECRGGEALDLIQAMTSGHGGSMSTLHANTPADALNRLETMALMSGVEIPLLALRAQIASAIDVIVQVARLNDGRRVVSAISEVESLSENSRYQLNQVFERTESVNKRTNSSAGQLRWTGESSVFGPAVKQQGLASRVELTKKIFFPRQGRSR
jgi:pilus assembly protein CpaF